MSLNKARGEVEFLIDGQSIHVLPTFEMIARLEGVVGGAMAFARKLHIQEWSVTEVVGAVQAVMRGNSDAPKANTIPDLILNGEGGVMAQIPPLMELLTNAMSGGKKPAPADEKDAAKNAEAG